MNHIKNISYIILCFNLYLTCSYASCLDLLKLMSMKDRVLKSDLIFSEHAIKNKVKKLSTFSKRLDSYNFNTVGMKVNEKQVQSNLIKPLKVITKDFVDIEKYKHWAENFYNDLMVQLSLPQNSQYKILFETHGVISKEIIIGLILERSIEGGFSGKIEDVEFFEIDNLEEPDFLRYINKGKYSFDFVFKDEDHGDLTHLFQLDFLIYTLKNNNIDPRLSYEVYTFFGTINEAMIVYIDPLDGWTPLDGWNTFFDGMIDHITSPEKLSPHLIELFSINKDEYPTSF